MRTLGPTITLLAFMLLVGCETDPQSRAETVHGLSFPASSEALQNSGNAPSLFPDRGLVTLLEIAAADLRPFLTQLTIEEKREPLLAKGSPLQNGWNVWPHDSKSCVPGNEVFAQLKQTWEGEAVPRQMMSCASPTGDWLHLEIWDLPEQRVLLKLYTDWN